MNSVNPLNEPGRKPRCRDVRSSLRVTELASGTVGIQTRTVCRQNLRPAPQPGTFLSLNKAYDFSNSRIKSQKKHCLGFHEIATNLHELIISTLTNKYLLYSYNLFDNELFNII